MDWNSYKSKFDEKFNSILNWMTTEFNKIRIGRATPAILDGILVDAYDEKMNFNQIANISVADARTLVIKPYDRSLIKNITTSLSTSNLGINPQVDADSIRLTFPSPTEDMRKELVKKAKSIAENAKVDVRKLRQSLQDDFKKDANALEDDKKYFNDELDAITKKSNQKIEELFNTREKEILTI
ncbi:MAG: ribosome recycling factor [Ureaplasma sp.]|nr:ribosome recycling factor [Ureaplasma sp.]MDE7221763.1 ribosome recycling factor [Ureaplasma sp.]